jgi:Uma2 family endonuclease
MVMSKLMSADELLALGEEAGRYELVEGEPREMSPASGVHGLIGSQLHGLLWVYLRSHDGGCLFMAETGFVVRREPDTVLSPDLAFLSSSKLPIREIAGGFVPMAPDLAVEIESPSNGAGELHRKVGMYLEAGTSVVWLVRPTSRTITVFRPGAVERVLALGDTLTADDLLPGFSAPLDEIFQPVAGRP